MINQFVLILFVILFSLLFINCHEAFQNNPDLEKLTQKICRVARENLKLEHPSPGDREMVLEYVKNRLQTTPLFLGQNTDQTKLIVQAMAVLAEDVNYLEVCYGQKGFRRYSGSISEDTQAFLETGDEFLNNKEKVLQKVESLVERTMKDASTPDEKRHVVGLLKRHLIENYSAAATSEKKNEAKTQDYIMMVSNYIDNAMEKILAKDGRRSPINYLPIEEDIEKEKSNNAILPLTTPPRPSVVLTKGGAPLEKDFCDQTMKQTCEDLQGMEWYKCPNADYSIKAQQVCDGAIDCPDESDEKNCLQQVIRKVHYATQVMSQIEISRFCFKSIFENSVIARQGALLTELLKSQIAFIKMYSNKKPRSNPNHQYTIPNMTPREEILDDPRPRRRLFHHDPALDDVVGEVALILRTFGSSLRAALCMPLSELVQRAVETVPFHALNAEINKMTKNNDNTDDDFTTHSCKCSGSRCAQATCPPSCILYCHRAYVLSRFRCKSVDQIEDSVSIDYVCDGKLDCFDETDEIGCATDANRFAKFEGNKYFDTVITMLKKKFLSRGYEMLRPTLADIQTNVQKIQKQCMSPKVNLNSFKRLRSRYYELVNEVYVEAMDNLPPGDGPDTHFADDVFEFLMDINGKIIEALKRTHTGNKKVILSDNCHCLGANCRSMNCPARCKRSCMVKHTLTNYICEKNLNSNDTKVVPIDFVCDGRIQCPGGDDEMKCSKEICRIHHARVLRMNIQAVGEKYKDSLMGDALEMWKGTVKPALMVLEQRERVTPRLMKNTISQVVNDLSLAFMTLDQFRRLNTEPILKKFNKLSQRIIESVKSCTK